MLKREYRSRDDFQILNDDDDEDGDNDHDDDDDDDDDEEEHKEDHRPVRILQTPFGEPSGPAGLDLA
ncbi:TPA_exp: Uncharacterized protein A8136_6494 [Trichophyton benhamiae CBS 112371]|nr:TPA_exp: Uncharacterized protein A8136_6494 [Trichophyton benhamiae CBS 112371]